MDAAGSQRATIYGWSEGGPMSLMFSATYPAWSRARARWRPHPPPAQKTHANMIQLTAIGLTVQLPDF